MEMEVQPTSSISMKRNKARSMRSKRSYSITVFFFMSVFSGLLAACWADGDPCTKLAEYLGEHSADFSFTRTEGDITVTATYQPPDLVECQGKNKDDNDPHDKANYSGFHYFQLKIGSKDERGIQDLLKRNFSKEEQEETANYYNYRLGADLKLVIANDTIPCTFYHHIQTGGVYKHLLLFTAFEARTLKDGEQATLLFQDKIFSASLLTFQFEGSKINQIPNLK